MVTVARFSWKRAGIWHRQSDCSLYIACFRKFCVTRQLNASELSTCVECKQTLLSLDLSPKKLSRLPIHHVASKLGCPQQELATKKVVSFLPAAI